MEAFSEGSNIEGIAESYMFPGYNVIGPVRVVWILLEMVVHELDFDFLHFGVVVYF